MQKQISAVFYYALLSFSCYQVLTIFKMHFDLCLSVKQENYIEKKPSWTSVASSTKMKIKRHIRNVFKIMNAEMFLLINSRKRIAG